MTNAQVLSLEALPLVLNARIEYDTIALFINIAYKPVVVLVLISPLELNTILYVPSSGIVKLMEGIRTYVLEVVEAVVVAVTLALATLAGGKDMSTKQGCFHQ